MKEGKRKRRGQEKAREISLITHIGAKFDNTSNPHQIV